MAVIVEALDRGLDQPRAAIVAVQALVLEEGAHAVEAGQVAVGRHDLEVRAFPKLHRRAEVADDEGDGLSEVPVRRVADQPGSGAGVGGDDHD